MGDSNPGIEGYFNPVNDSTAWKTNQVGFMVPRMKRIGDIEAVAHRESKFPTADTYKSPFEADWTSQTSKKNKQKSFGKRRRKTMTEQLSGDLKFIPGIGSFNVDPPSLRKTSYGGAVTLKNRSPRRVVGEMKKESPGPIYKDIDLGKFKYKNSAVGLPKANTRRIDKITKDDAEDFFAGYAKANIYVRKV